MRDVAVLLEGLSWWQLGRGEGVPALQRSSFVIMQLRTEAAGAQMQSRQSVHVGGCQWVNFAAEAGMDGRHLGGGRPSATTARPVLAPLVSVFG